MSRARKFDHGDARRLRRDGLSYEEIGRRFGVTGKAIALACDDDLRRRDRVNAKKWQQGGTCPECGEPATRHSKTAQLHCRSCALRPKAKIRDGEAYCPCCARWRSLDAFRIDASRPVRGVASRCRDCETAKRRAHRQANLDHTRAYDRERRRRLRAAA